MMMKEGYCQILLRSLKNSLPGNNKSCLVLSQKRYKIGYFATPSPPPHPTFPPEK